MTAPDRVLLSDGTRLVHIGPHKTGTTTLQGAFHLARRAAAAQGVHYAGRNRQPLHAAQAIAGVGGDARRAAIGLRPWHRLVEDIEAADEPRVLASSEWFADAMPEGIQLLANDLDRSRVHIAVTLRPLGRILSSQWQQFAQAGHTRAYEPWLETAFREPDVGAGRTFWHRHRHDRLVERWAQVVGVERVTVVVADDRDRTALLRAFEALTGLRTGTLVAPDDRQNRSLTAAEIELVRQLHVAMRHEGIEPGTRMNVVLFGAAQQLKLRAAERDEARIETPAWALEESAAIAREAVEGIRASGVRVIGDLDSLLLAEPPAPAPPAAVRKPSPTDWPALAALASMGLVGFSGLARSSKGSDAEQGWPDSATNRAAPSPDMEPRSSVFPGMDAVDGMSTSRLFGIFSARLSQSLRARLPRPIRARRGSAEAR